MEHNYDQALRMPYPQLEKACQHEYRDKCNNLYFWARKAHQDFGIPLDAFRQTTLSPQERYRTFYDLMKCMKGPERQGDIDNEETLRPCLLELFQDDDKNTILLFLDLVRDTGRGRQALLDTLEQPEVVRQISRTSDMSLVRALVPFGPLEFPNSVLFGAIYEKKNPLVHQLIDAYQDKFSPDAFQVLLRAAKEVNNREMASYFEYRLQPMRPPTFVPRSMSRRSVR